MIKSITYKNFKLLKNLSLFFDNINIIKGDNGCGKSTLIKGIIYALYGEASGTNLQRLISFGEKSTEIKLDTKDFNIARKIPNELSIFVNEKPLEFNTPTLKQNWIDNEIGDYKFFQKYRLINKQAVNILDYAKDSRSIITLRKELMSFIDDIFSSVRQNFLNQKLERENKSIDKRLYKFHLSERRLKNLEEGLKKRTEDLLQAKTSLDEQYNVLGKFKSEIDSRNKLIYYKEQDKRKLNNGICPILNTKCSTISEQSDKVNKDKTKEISDLQSEIKQIKVNSQSEQEAFDYFKENSNLLEQKKRKTQECIMKLKEAFKFQDYKYNKKDIEIYNNVIKVFDEFAGWHIQQWLDSLTFIINDLLTPMNLSVEFSSEKEFMTITNEGQICEWNDLSSGQQIFLNVIFKLAILLHNGITDGIIIIDDGINDLLIENMEKLVEILKKLPFQVFLVYQNVQEIKNVNTIKLERKGNESKVK